MGTTFTVSTIGVASREMHMLKAIFALSRTRSATFELATESSSSSADVVIVNQDNPAAMAEWHSMFADKHRTPAIRLTNHNPRDTELLYIKKPFIASRVLALLDQVSMSELDVAQDLAIAEGSDQTINRSLPIALAKPKKRTITALVVDDSLPVRIQMGLALRKFATHVDFAETGAKALEYIETDHYDIIFLDVILPDADGYELCKRIKTDGDRKSTPVIMLTSNSAPADHVKGLLAGCDTYLVKPVNGEVFREVVDEFLH